MRPRRLLVATEGSAQSTKPRRRHGYVAARPALGANLSAAASTQRLSRRLVVLAPVTVARSGCNTAGQASDRLAIGSAYRDSGLVCTHPDGTAVKPATVSRVFDRLVTEAKVPRITLHGTWHTWATLALLEGIPAKVVAEVLGHSSTQVTLDVYSHVDTGMQADTTSRVASLLSKGLFEASSEHHGRAFTERQEAKSGTRVCVALLVAPSAPAKPKAFAAPHHPRCPRPDRRRGRR